MFIIRTAVPADLDYLTWADLRTGREDEGLDPSLPAQGEPAFVRQREKIAAFVRDEDKGALLGLWSDDHTPAGMLLYRIRARSGEERRRFQDGTIFDALDPELFPEDGRFGEVFQLWVEPEYRRKGLGSLLKEQLECELRRLGIRMIYTHTRERNLHVLALNRRLGYREVRRGPIWDEVVRVSLVKTLE